MNNLKKIRMKNGLSQRQLSNKANVNVRMLQKYEQGVIDVDNANLLTLLKLAIGLNCNISELVSSDELILTLNLYESRKDNNEIRK